MTCNKSTPRVFTGSQVGPSVLGMKLLYDFIFGLGSLAIPTLDDLQQAIKKNQCMSQITVFELEINKPFL